jgi:predicted metal-binding membrane protein
VWTAQSDSRVFAGLIVALIAIAWLALIAWGLSPYGSSLSHGELAETQLRLDGEYLIKATVFAAGWALMTIAMMLPTTLPLLQLFWTITRRRSNRRILMALLLTGYLVTSLLFGVSTHLADFWIHRAVESNVRLHANTWLLAAAPVLIAGAYQSTPLKYVCLDWCRSPYSFIMEQWRGRNTPVQSLRLGVRHGIFCVGCCWSLMLLMFAIATGNFVWMLGLSVVMAVEKNMKWGKAISAPLGVVLLTAGGTIIAINL